jgi:hypothetical protein
MNTSREGADIIKRWSLNLTSAGQSINGSWEKSTYRTQLSTDIYALPSCTRSHSITLPHSNAATGRSEAEILVYLQRERAQGMDEL